MDGSWALGEESQTKDNASSQTDETSGLGGLGAGRHHDCLAVLIDTTMKDRWIIGLLLIGSSVVLGGPNAESALPLKVSQKVGPIEMVREISVAGQNSRQDIIATYRVINISEAPLYFNIREPDANFLVALHDAQGNLVPRKRDPARHPQRGICLIP